MNSCIYQGYISHRRFRPRPHAFRYQLFMMYLDLAELDTVFADNRFWSTRRWAPARFCREDHFGDPAQPLDLCVRDLVERETGQRPRGPIRLLTHLRYFGYCFNPISIFYCFDAEDKRVEALVAEVTNTPWKERVCYVLTAGDEIDTAAPATYIQRQFRKGMHVSPFMPMGLDYDWRSNTPDERLTVFMKLTEKNNSDRLFDATLDLHRQTISKASLNRVLFSFPLMTLKVIATIHWEAVRLWLKRTPLFDHPR